MKLKKGFIVQKINQSINIFDSSQSVLHELNETGSFIFEKIRAGKSSGEIIKNLSKRYNISGETAQKDLEAFIETLAKKKILG